MDSNTVCSKHRFFTGAFLFIVLFIQRETYALLLGKADTINFVLNFPWLLCRIIVKATSLHTYMLHRSLANGKSFKLNFIIALKTWHKHHIKRNPITTKSNSTRYTWRFSMRTWTGTHQYRASYYAEHFRTRVNNLRCKHCALFKFGFIFQGSCWVTKEIHKLFWFWNSWNDA